MDIEANLRNQLCDRLSVEFDTAQEVYLTLENGSQGRADVVAAPHSNDFQNTLFVFEVKTASDRNFQKWTHVFKQAFDYFNAKVIGGTWGGRIINAAFVFPSPPYAPSGGELASSNYWRSHEAGKLAGVMHMASMLKVGTARIKNQNPRKGLNLCFGPNSLWLEGHGWFEDAHRLLSSERHGSRRVRKAT